MAAGVSATMAGVDAGRAFGLQHVPKARPVVKALPPARPAHVRAACPASPITPPGAAAREGAPAAVAQEKVEEEEEDKQARTPPPPWRNLDYMMRLGAAAEGEELDAEGVPGGSDRAETASDHGSSKRSAEESSHVARDGPRSSRRGGWMLRAHGLIKALAENRVDDAKALAAEASRVPAMAALLVLDGKK
jgi:hypothetical protein